MEKKGILLRINELMEFFDFTKSQFADKIGMDKSNFSKLFKDSKPIGSGIITKIAYSLNINKDWLAEGKGSMLKPEKEVNSIKKPLIEYVTTAPLIGQYAHAGYLAGWADTEYIEQQPVYAASKKFSNGNYVAFEIRGDSMEDGQRHAIYNSDIVLGRELIRDYWKCKIHYPKAFVIVHRTKGIICKEIIGHDVEHGIITCHSFNPEYEDFELNLKDIVQLFYIKEIKREP